MGLTAYFPNEHYDYADAQKEAERVLAGLRRNCELRGYATVADLYRLMDLSHPQLVDETNDAYRGWTDLAEAYMKSGMNGYKIVFPNPVTIRA